MKVCVSARGTGLDSPVDERFGRAEVFLLVDTETMETKVISNSKAADAHGVGIAAGSLMAEAGAEAVLTGHCGPKALEVLSAAGIRVFNGARDRVRDTIEAFGRGELPEASVPGQQR